MSETTERLTLPYILPQQAQKHVTHNEALRMLDALVQLVLTTLGENAPPENPDPGSCHAVGAAPTGLWSGQAGAIGAWQDGAWAFHQPQAGWMAWDAGNARLVVHDGTDWLEATSGGATASEVTTWGVNAAPDLTNRLSVAAHGSLFSNDGADHRLTINKAAQADTASVLFQSGWAGRAEIGLCGDEDFHLKVSEDGLAFTDAMHVDRATGKVNFPATNMLNDFVINLYGDSGRFAGNGETGITISGFQFPDYFTFYNGASAAGAGKFIHNNSTHGGTAGPLLTHVDELISKIREPGGFRRYGNEFNIAQITAGGGTTGSFSHEGANGVLSLFTQQAIRPPVLTFHAYLQAVDSPIILRAYDGQTYTIDGVEQPGSVVITPEDGWLSVAVADAQPLRTSYGYSPNTVTLYAQPGARYRLACAMLLPGLVRIDPDTGVVAAINGWSA